MKFFVFVCPHYYPGGGVHDLERVCDTLEEAREVQKWARKEHGTNNNDIHIMDGETGQIVN